MMTIILVGCQNQQTHHKKVMPITADQTFQMT